MPEKERVSRAVEACGEHQISLQKRAAFSVKLDCPGGDVEIPKKQILEPMMWSKQPHSNMSELRKCLTSRS